MAEKREYEMSQEDYDKIMEAIAPQPYIIIGGVGPESPQVRANRAWEALGHKMGFKYITAKPSNRSKLHFWAEPNEAG